MNESSIQQSILISLGIIIFSVSLLQYFRHDPTKVKNTGYLKMSVVGFFLFTISISLVSVALFGSQENNFASGLSEPFIWICSGSAALFIVISMAISIWSEQVLKSVKGDGNSDDKNSN